MKKTTFVLLTSMITVLSVFLTLVVAAKIISLWLVTNESPLSSGLLVFGYTLLFAPLGLIPAYFISMKLAEILRQKYGWPLRHPRRLFLLALAIPISLLILPAIFLR